MSNDNQTVVIAQDQESLFMNNIDDVLAIQLAKYECQVLEAIDDAKKQVADTTKALRQFNEDIRNAAIAKVKVADVKMFGNLKVKQLETEAVIDTVDKVKVVSVTVNYSLLSELSTNYIHDTTLVPLTKAQLTKLHKLNEECDVAKKALQEASLKNSQMPQKERQIKARIAEMKLSKIKGMDELLNDKQLMKLTTL